MTDIDEIERMLKAGDYYGHACSPSTVLGLCTDVRRLRADANRYRRLKSFAHPSYNMTVTINELSASLSKREFLTVHAGTWEAMDTVLDGVVAINTVNVKEGV